MYSLVVTFLFLGNALVTLESYRPFETEKACQDEGMMLIQELSKAGIAQEGFIECIIGEGL